MRACLGAERIVIWTRSACKVAAQERQRQEYWTSLARRLSKQRQGHVQMLPCLREQIAQRRAKCGRQLTREDLLEVAAVTLQKIEGNEELPVSSISGQ